MKTRILALILLYFPLVVSAGDVKIQHAEFVQNQNGWRVAVRIQHDDDGWDHFANAWRIVDQDGKVLGTRILMHPHSERPFTRSLDEVVIPSEKKVVYVEARDSVHGWSKDRVKVDLDQKKGDRYNILHR